MSTVTIAFAMINNGSQSRIGHVELLMSRYRSIAGIVAVGICVLVLLIMWKRSRKNELEVAELGAVVQREYVISDIIHSYDSPKSTPERIDEWIVCVTANIEPGNWNNGNISISAVHKNESILATCTPVTHDRISELFEGVRKMNTSRAAQPYTFLGIAEDEQSNEGPVGLIGGKAIQVSNVSKVQEVPYAEYTRALESSRIVAEERHEGFVYWAVKEQRDVPFANATAWVTVLERFKSRMLTQPPSTNSP